jgi:hypothetical protein
MGIGFPHDHLIAGCGSRTKKGNGEWGMGNGEWGQGSYFTTPHSLYPTPHSPSSSAIIAKPGEFSLDSVAA